MKKGNHTGKEGFTIIETALVLAIAGLIFLMIFIALPALQRSQRDTARREDMTELIASIKKYQTNNRGALPGGTNGVVSYNKNSSAAANTWEGFLRDYMDQNKFVDPSTGGNYRLNVIACGGSKVDASCGNTAKNVIVNIPNDYTAYVILQAKCSGNESEPAVTTNNPRKLAVLYRLEGSGVYCENT